MRTASLLMILVVMVPAVGAASVDLSYGPPVGTSWTTQLHMEADIPFSGTQEVRVSYELSSQSMVGDDVRMGLFVPQTTVAGHTVGPVEATFNLREDGMVSQLQSSDLTDPQVAPLLRNVGVLFPRLPGGIVDVGSSWTDMTVLHLAGIEGGRTEKSPRVPDQIRVEATYQLRELQGPWAIIDVTLKEASGQPVRVNLTGIYVVDTTNRKPWRLELAGNIRVRRAFLWITVPVSMSATEQP